MFEPYRQGLNACVNELYAWMKTVELHEIEALQEKLSEIFGRVGQSSSLPETLAG